MLASRLVFGGRAAILAACAATLRCACQHPRANVCMYERPGRDHPLCADLAVSYERGLRDRRGGVGSPLQSLRLEDVDVSL